MNAGTADWLRRVGIPSTALHPRWEDVPTSGGFRDVLRSYCETLRGRVASGHGLILSGPVGVGKTCALALIAAEVELQAIGCSCHFIRLPDLYEKLHRCSRGEIIGDYGERRSFEDLAEWHCGLLLLDDLGTQYASPFAQAQWHSLMEHRYSEALATCITTNLSVPDLRADGEMARVYDRLRETCVCVATDSDEPSKRRQLTTADWA